MYQFDPILKEINYSLTRNDDVPERVSENTDTYFNGILHDTVQCVTKNNANTGFYDSVEYLMGDIICEILYTTAFMMKTVQITTTPSPIVILTMQ